jgi:multidrug efflux system outer membrane protein
MNPPGHETFAQRMRSVLALVGTGVLLAVGGCAVGPDYSRPAAPVPETYAATNIWKIAEPRAGMPKGNWWEVFGDAELDRLEADAAVANQQLKAAVASFEQARAFVDVSRAGLFPHVGLSPTYLRSRDSANRPVNGTSSGTPDNPYNTFIVPATASYEVDIWGQVRRTVESAKAGAVASADDVETVRLGIQAEVATDFFALHALDAEIAILQSSVKVFQKSLDLTRNRRAGGIATDLDVAQAETILKTTEALIPDTRLQRVRTEHALAVLTGRAPSGFNIPEKSLTLAPPILPAGLPSELLERRPDIAAAERRVAAANANIGVAKSAFYPQVQLNGIAGFESVSAGTLFDWPSRFWALGPTVTAPIFEGGQLKANLRTARAAYDQTVANYRQSVLTAFSEVEDNLAAQQLLLSEYDAQVAALKAAQKTLEIANNRYRAGLVTYLEVATAQNAALELERTVVQLRGNQLITTISLIKSLGGGWEAPKSM